MQISSFNSLNEIFFLQCEKYQKEDHLFFNNLNLKKFQTYTWSDTTNSQKFIRQRSKGIKKNNPKLHFFCDRICKCNKGFLISI